ncbi:uncharacterized mitochondrial protein AtMg00820-like [Manihot esculenta]|uniref:uncharacterized mitochondrial protein AtMg00820-like n=1 Tax=Manihot esculenta TaxID=3983 RepID=UPI000B5D7975|nr:uncharacterized mitochondrial protein AtMg00820-like [Manihot esculenta]
MELEWEDDIERNTIEEENTVEEGVIEEVEINSPAVAAELLAREGRNRYPPVWMADYASGESLCEDDEANMAFLMISDPANFKEAIGVKWIYKTKLNELGEADKYKARLVMKGYTQQYGIDYTEVFAPVARMDIVRIIIASVAQKG